MPGNPKIPLNQPWSLRINSEILDDYMVEVVDSKAENYRQLIAGSPHPNRSQYAGYRFVDDDPIEGSDRLIHQFWTKDYHNQDATNYTIEYAENSTDHPLWARRYLTRRDGYTAIARGTAFTGIFLIKVTAGGSGYNSAPDVTIAGTGTGATATAVLSSDGSVAWVRVSAEGSGYTGTPTVAFNGGGGSGATATVLMQGGSILQMQKIEPMPDSDPRRSLYVVERRVYRTLPGPSLVGITNHHTRSFGDKVTVTSQDVLASTATQTDPTFASGIIESRLTPVDSVVSKSEVVTIYNGGIYQPVWSTHIDEKTGICVDIQKTWIVAGTVGGIGCVKSLTINNAGSGYTPTTPIVAGTPTPTSSYYDLTFTGGGGHGATGKAIVGAGGTITSVILTFGGAGYTSVPTVTLSGHGGSGGTCTPTIATGYVEVNDYDQWASIAITSLIRDGNSGQGSTTIPADKVYPITLRESFPPELRNVALATVEGTVIKSGFDSVSYSGPVKGRITRKYMTDAQYASWDTVAVGTIFTTRPAISQFFPQANRIIVTIAGGTTSAGTFPNSLHDTVSLSLLAGAVTATLPATTPTAVPHDTWIVRSIKEEQWTLGYWLVEIEEIYVPAY